MQTDTYKYFLSNTIVSINSFNSRFIYKNIHRNTIRKKLLG